MTRWAGSFRTTQYASAVGPLANFDWATIEAAVNAVAGCETTERCSTSTMPPGGSASCCRPTAAHTGRSARAATTSIGNLVESRRYDRYVTDAWIATVDATNPPGVSEQDDDRATERRSATATARRARWPTSSAPALPTTRRTGCASRSTRSEAVVENVYDALGRRHDDRALRRAADAGTVHGTRDRRGGRPQRRRQSRAALRVRRELGQLRFNVQVIEPNVGSGGKHAINERRYDALGQLVESRAYATTVGHLDAYDEATIAAAIVPDRGERSSLGDCLRRGRAASLRRARAACRMRRDRIRGDEAGPRRAGPARPADRLCLARGADAVRHSQRR